ncbi:MAG: hypothetical protein OEY49_18855 [Candidatus Heimdallarchaeota archaeon]|nr:hypothetical protein [Candidatus Heimdallarchaeota archaeon]
MDQTFDWNFSITKSYDSGKDLIIEGDATVDTMDSEDEVVVFDSVVKSMETFMEILRYYR